MSQRRSLEKRQLKGSKGSNVSIYRVLWGDLDLTIHAVSFDSS